MKGSRFVFTLWIAAGLASRSAPASVGWQPDPQLLQKARVIHKRIIAFDSHLDLPYEYAGAADDGKTQFDLPKVIRS